jgi:hypothetical protein
MGVRLGRCVSIPNGRIEDVAQLIIAGAASSLLMSTKTAFFASKSFI